MGQHSVNMVAKPCESMGFSMVFAFRLLLGQDRAKIGQHLFQMGRHSIKMGQPRAQQRRHSPQRGPTWPPYLGQPCPKTAADPGGNLGGTWGRPLRSMGFRLFCGMFVFVCFFVRLLAFLARMLGQHSLKPGQHSPKMAQPSAQDGPT